MERIEKLEQRSPEASTSEEAIKEQLNKVEVSRKYTDLKTNLISDTVQHLYDVVGDLTKRLENVELNTTKRHMTISGLAIEGKKDAMIREVEAFIEYELGVYVQIEDMYKLGMGDPPQVVFILQNLQDKFTILKNRSKLKSVKNERDQPFYINEYYPMAINEKKRWEREIQKQNDARQEKEQAEIVFKGGKMLIDGKEYIKAVKEPEPEDILDFQIE